MVVRRILWSSQAKDGACGMCGSCKARILPQWVLA